MRNGDELEREEAVLGTGGRRGLDCIDRVEGAPALHHGLMARAEALPIVN